MFLLMNVTCGWHWLRYRQSINKEGGHVLDKATRWFLWKHFGFCEKGERLDKTVAVYHLCKWWVKFNGNGAICRRGSAVVMASQMGINLSWINRSRSCYGNGTDRKGVAALFILKHTHKSPRVQRITYYCAAGL